MPRYKTAKYGLGIGEWRKTTPKAIITTTKG